MTEDGLTHTELERCNSSNEHIKSRDYNNLYNRDGKLGTQMYNHFPLWMIQQESNLAGYGIVSKWNPSYVHIDTAFRRRLQSKDNTGALRMWLLRHKKNPYPSKPEKIMLAILSRMTMTQVSTWFANARRRLKKEFPESDDQTESICDNEHAHFRQQVYVDPS